MKFFNQTWEYIQEKCYPNMYKYENITDGTSPYTLISTWLLSRETLEIFSDNPECIHNTTPEKAKIRHERLDIFLPHLEKEYSTFIKIAKKQNIISNLIKINGILSIIIFLALFYSSAKFFILLTPLIKNILTSTATTHTILIRSTVNIVSLLLIAFSFFISWRIGARFPYILTHPLLLLLCTDDFKKHVKAKKDTHLRSFFKDTPYTVAFLMGNGFVDTAFFGPHETDKYYWHELTDFVVPYKEIKKLNFNEFINYIKLRVEPVFKSYHRINNYVDAPKYFETKPFHSVFFYLNEEDFKNTSKLRSKTLKSAPFSSNIDYYYREPKEPDRTIDGKIIRQRKERDHSNNYNTYSNHSNNNQQYNQPRIKQTAPKVKKESSYDRALSEWKEQLIISALLENDHD